MVVKILDVISSASTYDDGEAVFQRILGPIRSGQPVVVDFDGIPSVPSAFVNAALVRLLEYVSFEQIRKTLTFANSTRQINDLIRRRFEFVTKEQAAK